MLEVEENAVFASDISSGDFECSQDPIDEISGIKELNLTFPPQHFSETASSRDKPILVGNYRENNLAHSDFSAQQVESLNSERLDEQGKEGIDSMNVTQEISPRQFSQNRSDFSLINEEEILSSIDVSTDDEKKELLAGKKQKNDPRTEKTKGPKLIFESKSDEQFLSASSLAPSINQPSHFNQNLHFGNKYHFESALNSTVDVLHSEAVDKLGSEVSFDEHESHCFGYQNPMNLDETIVPNGDECFKKSFKVFLEKLKTVPSKHSKKSSRRRRSLRSLIWRSVEKVREDRMKLQNEEEEIKRKSKRRLKSCQLPERLEPKIKKIPEPVLAPPPKKVIAKPLLSEEGKQLWEMDCVSRLTTPKSLKKKKKKEKKKDESEEKKDESEEKKDKPEEKKDDTEEKKDEAKRKKKIADLKAPNSLFERVCRSIETTKRVPRRTRTPPRKPITYIRWMKLLTTPDEALSPNEYQVRHKDIFEETIQTRMLHLEEKRNQKIKEMKVAQMPSFKAEKLAAHPEFQKDSKVKELWEKPIFDRDLQSPKKADDLKSQSEKKFHRPWSLCPVPKEFQKKETALTRLTIESLKEMFKEAPKGKHPYLKAMRKKKKEKKIRKLTEAEVHDMFQAEKMPIVKGFDEAVNRKRNALKLAEEKKKADEQQIIDPDSYPVNANFY